MDPTQATTQATQLQLYLPGFWDVIKRIVGFLNHDDARNLNQTCKSWHKHVPHKCLPPSIQVIDVNDLNKLKNGELAELEALILNEISLGSKLWFKRIKRYCPKLKYLFIKYSCERDVLMLDFENLPCVGISIKINILKENCLLSICNLSSTVKSFTADISSIDPETPKTILGEYKGTIYLDTNTFEKLKSW
jgi:hypothetical protein